MNFTCQRTGFKSWQRIVLALRQMPMPGSISLAVQQYRGRSVINTTFTLHADDELPAYYAAIVLHPQVKKS
jgi:hypothetical protein